MLAIPSSKSTFVHSASNGAIDAMSLRALARLIEPFFPRPMPRSMFVMSARSGRPTSTSASVALRRSTSVALSSPQSNEEATRSSGEPLRSERMVFNARPSMRIASRLPSLLSSERTFASPTGTSTGGFLRTELFSSALSPENASMTEAIFDNSHAYRLKSAVWLRSSDGNTCMRIDDNDMRSLFFTAESAFFWSWNASRRPSSVCSSSSSSEPSGCSTSSSSVSLVRSLSVSSRTTESSGSPMPAARFSRTILRLIASIPQDLRNLSTLVYKAGTKLFPSSSTLIAPKIFASRSDRFPVMIRSRILSVGSRNARPLANFAASICVMRSTVRGRTPSEVC